MPLRPLLVLLLATACKGTSPPPKAPQESPIEPVADDGMVALSAGDLRGVVFADNPVHPRPVIIAMHGLGDHPTRFSRLTQGWADTATIVVPAAPTPYHDGFSWFPVSGRKDSSQLAAAVDETARRVVQLVNARRAADVPVVVTGFSQGGMLSFALATRQPSVVDAAVPVGGFLPRGLWPESLPDNAPAILALHGEADSVIPVDAPRATVAHLESIGWQADLKTWPGVGHSIPGPMRSALDKALADGIKGRLAGPSSTSAPTAIHPR
mgnify:CR=1 FL=1